VTGFILAGRSAASSGRIYPNVSAGGVELGGLTVEEAAAKLEEAGGNPYAGRTVTVSFAGVADELVITSEEAGLVDTSADAAARVYEYGRGEGFISDTINYLTCLLRGSTVDSYASKAIDEAAVRAKIDETARSVNSELMQNSLVIEDTRVTIIKGASGILVDTDVVYDLVADAFAKGASTVEYAPETTDPKEIDLDDIWNMVTRDPVNAEFDEKFNVIPSETGVTFDRARAEELLAKAKTGDKVYINLSRVEPEITTEALEATLFSDLLASKSTVMTNIAVRSKNVELASDRIDGLVLMPGEVFSFNGVVGQRKREDGYGEAIAYVNGESVPQVGGGVCQMSSTIYYACLYADLEIVYRTCHLYISSYVPYGMDATVSWPSPDFKFANSTPYPIKLHTWRDGQTISCEIWGTRTDFSYDHIDMQYEVKEWLDPKDDFKADPSMAPGSAPVLKTSGSKGLICNTYKVKYDADGKVISRTYVANSIYSPHNNVYLCAYADLPLYLTPEQLDKIDYVTPEPTPTPEETPEPTPETTPEPTPTPDTTPEPTDTPEPTESPEPTETPEPTDAPEPTDSPEPTPDPTPDPTPEP
jgi:vancomycin resistance protein YoaR